MTRPWLAMRETLILRKGKWLRKSDAPPLHASERGPSVIGDVMPDMMHPANGKRYDSKSRFRAETRARGLTEIGNDRMPARRNIDLPPVRDDIRRAISELGGGS